MSQDWSAPHVSRRILGLYLCLSGVVSLGAVIDATVLSGPFRAVGLLVGALLYGGMVFAGVGLIRRSRFGTWLGWAIMLIQVPVIQAGRVTWSVFSSPSLEFKLFPRFGFAYEWFAGFAVTWLDTPRPYYVGMNLGAAIMVGLIGSHLDRQPTSATPSSSPRPD